MPKKQINQKQKLLRIIGISIIIIIVMLCVIKYFKNNTDSYKNVEDYTKFSEEYQKKAIIPRKVYNLYEYEGEYDRDYLYKNIRNFVDYIDYLKNNVKIKDSKISKFFKKKSEDILQYTGIDKEQQFKNFILKLNENNVAVEEFKYAEIENGSTMSNNNYFYFNLLLYYGENNTPVKFKVAFSEMNRSKKTVIYEIID